MAGLYASLLLSPEQEGSPEPESPRLQQPNAMPGENKKSQRLRLFSWTETADKEHIF
jgi:hypothetical protein